VHKKQTTFLIPDFVQKMDIESAAHKYSLIHWLSDAPV